MKFPILLRVRVRAVWYERMYGGQVFNHQSHFRRVKNNAGNQKVQALKRMVLRQSTEMPAWWPQLSARGRGRRARVPGTYRVVACGQVHPYGRPNGLLMTSRQQDGARRSDAGRASAVWRRTRSSPTRGQEQGEARVDGEAQVHAEVQVHGEAWSTVWRGARAGSRRRSLGLGLGLG